MSLNAGNLIRRAAKVAAFGTLEELLTSRDGFGLETATPVQRAICRAAEGRPLGDLWDDDNVRKAFGVRPMESPYEEILILAGIRGAKSLIAACGSVYQTQTCSFSYGTHGHKLGPGEVPRVSVISVQRDLADVVYNHVVGNVTSSPYLKALLMSEPTADTVTLRHPSGRPVEIKVVAGAKSGSTLVARWSAGVVFDEAPRMQSAEEGVVNLPEMRASVRLRLLRGARIWYIGSPYQPYGLAYDWKNEFWGRPNAKVLVVVAPAWVMNPFVWTKEVVDEYRRAEPEAAKTDLDAEFADPEQALYANDRVVSCMRPARGGNPWDEDLEPEEGVTYVAAMDPATRSNGWTLAVAAKLNGKITIAALREWRPANRSSPLDPREVMRDVAAVCRRYRIELVMSDQWSSDSLRVFAADEGLGWYQEDFRGVEKASAYISFARYMEAGMVSLPFVEQLRVDLVSVKKRATTDGVKIVLPTTSDGRHADTAPAVVMASSVYLEEKPPPPPPDPDDEYDETEALEDRELASIFDEDGDEWDSDGDEDLWGRDGWI